MAKPLQYIQMDLMVFVQSILVKLSYIFHLIITHSTITEEKIDKHIQVQLLPTKKIKETKTFAGIIYSAAGDQEEKNTETGAGGAVNIETTSPSARERMIQSVGVHLLWLVREYRRLLDKMDKMEEEMNERVYEENTASLVCYWLLKILTVFFT